VTPLDAVRRRLEEACGRAGRDPTSIRLVAASKSQSSQRLRRLWLEGQRIFGENRVQEAARKAEELSLLDPPIDWHLLGPLQSNKVRAAVRLFSTVHSVDRVEIALALDREAAAQGRRLSGLLEINLGGEASKHGFAAHGLAAAVAAIAGCEHLRIEGLMAIPPPADDPEASRPWFRRLRDLRDELFARPEWRGRRSWLSMGMSGDFEVAIEEGATHVRVGTALFGPRA
jgi:pyridoxal phosphate enzyme (YggS family)